MESEVGNMRFVSRCPKCSKLHDLSEYSNVPMYQCGGCNAILQAKHYTSNNEKQVIESSDTNIYHEKGESSDVALEISSVFSLHIKDENWSYQNSTSSSFENSSQISRDKSYLGSPNRKKRNDSLMQNMSSDEENEGSRNSFSALNQNSISNHSSNHSICAESQTSRTSLSSESFYSVGSRIEYENEETLPDSPSTSLNNRTELLRTVDKLRNQLEVVFKTAEQNKRMYKFLTENANPGSSKRYVVPVSKGAPFVICYKCLEMLHIPLNMRIMSMRFNKLKCSSCLEVLRLRFPSRGTEKSLVSEESGDDAETVNSTSIEDEASVRGTSGAEIEQELQASKDAPEVKYTLHQLMGYMSARMLLQ